MINIYLCVYSQLDHNSLRYNFKTVFYLGEKVNIGMQDINKIGGEVPVKTL